MGALAVLHLDHDCPMKFWLTVIALAVLLPGALQAQPGIVHLSPASVEFPDEFSRLASVRELSDGRILITDDIENRLLVARHRSGATTVTQIGRIGSGPAEYRVVGSLSALSADSTLFPDLLNRRFIILVGAEIVGAIPGTNPMIESAGYLLRGTDKAGRVLGERPLPGTPTERGRRFDMELVRFDRGATKAETIARLRGRESVTTASTSANGQFQGRIVSTVHVVPEQGVMFTDGWIAVALQDPYRVDWREPAGRWIRGSPIPWSAPRIDEAEKRHWVMRSQRESASGSPVNAGDLAWAETIPPYRMDALFPAPAGALLVRRALWSGSIGNDYDIIDRAGARRATLRLPENERILGFGARVVFVAVTDDDGIDRLRVHPWKAF